jgi:hypothetical protein
MLLYVAEFTITFKESSDREADGVNCMPGSQPCEHNRQIPWTGRPDGTRRAQVLGTRGFGSQ